MKNRRKSAYFPLQFIILHFQQRSPAVRCSLPSSDRSLRSVLLLLRHFRQSRRSHQTAIRHFHGTILYFPKSVFELFLYQVGVKKGHLPLLQCGFSLQLPLNQRTSN